MIALALALVLAIDGGAADAPLVAPASGYIGISSGLFLTDEGQTMIVDGGVWADDATVRRTALEKRTLRENLKLAQEAQQAEITQYVAYGAAGGAGAVILVVLLVLAATGLAK
ncbi:MAG: hypothetical protein WAV09_03315 [Minisyncoccia bacterium]